MLEGDKNETDLYRAGLPHAAVNARMDVMVDTIRAISERLVALELQVKPPPVPPNPVEPKDEY